MIYKNYLGGINMKFSEILKSMEYRYGVNKIFRGRRRFIKELVEVKAIEDYKYKMPSDGVIYDLATGHGMLAATLALWKPRSLCIGVDKQYRKHWDNFYSIQNLLFIQGDIFNMDYVLEPDFIVSVHPCRELAFEVCNTAIKYNAPLILMPCCVSLKLLKEYTNNPGLSSFIKAYNHVKVEEDRKYVNWVALLAYHLETNGYTVSVRRPKYLTDLTPKSMIIYAR